MSFQRVTSYRGWGTTDWGGETKAASQARGKGGISSVGLGQVCCHLGKGKVRSIPPTTPKNELQMNKGSTREDTTTGALAANMWETSCRKRLSDHGSKSRGNRRKDS